MSFLQNLFGDAGERRDYRDFVDRYHTGVPWEGYSDQEVLDRFQQVAPQLSAEEVAEATQGALAQLTPDQQQELADYLQQTQAQAPQGGAEGTTLANFAGGDQGSDVLAHLGDEPGPGAAGGPFDPRGAGGGGQPGAGGLGDLLGSILGGGAPGGGVPAQRGAGSPSGPFGGGGGAADPFGGLAGGGGGSSDPLGGLLGGLMGGGAGGGRGAPADPFGGLLGGGGGGPLGGGPAGGLLDQVLGGGAPAGRGGQSDSILANPLVKAVLAGIVAMAAQKMLGGGDSGGRRGGRY